MNDSVEPETFRRAIALWASGVSVVTARDGPADHGMTVNSVVSVALRPPTLLVSLAETAETTPVVERTGVFGISVLTAAQRPLSERFAKAVPSEEKFRGTAVHRGTTGVALLDGALATFECRVERQVVVADHHLVVGTVVACTPGVDDLPLVFYRSRYAEPSLPGALQVGPGA